MLWPDHEELNPVIVDDAYEFIVQFLRERHPELDADRGLLGSCICGIHAMLHAAQREAVIRELAALPAAIPVIPPSFASKDGIRAIFKAEALTNPVFRKIQALSIVGAGEPELSADCRNCVDIYLLFKTPETATELAEIRQIVCKDRPVGFTVRVLPAIVVRLDVLVMLEGPASASIDQGCIKKATAAAVNARGFSNKISTSVIAAAVQPFLPIDVDIQSIRLRVGDQMCTDVLTIATEEPGCSANTLAIRLDPAHVEIVHV